MVYRCGIRPWYTGETTKEEMTTARERYEAKTRVVTFRVKQELYEEIEKVRKEADLSFTDLIKLGAGIAREEIQKKLSEVGQAQAQLADLRKTIRQEQKALDAFIDASRKEHLTKLKEQYRVYTLFDAGYTPEEVRFELHIGQADADRHFKEWAKLRGAREKLQIEFLRKCLQNRVGALKEHIRYRAVGKELEEAKEQLAFCRQMLIDPSKLGEDEKAFLIAEYSYLL